jgi:uracil-DNA glycosylase
MRADEEERFRRIFRSAHADHAACATDEWLMQPCRGADGVAADRPLVWSRRNGAWQRVAVLWVGAAPGNAGGLGSSDLGAHGTRIPFGGDIAGGNLDVLLASIGLSRNDTFIVASLNQLPARGGGEPTTAELAAPVGLLPDSVALLRDTVIAAGPTLVVALGNVALRTLAAALTRPDRAAPAEPRLCSPPGSTHALAVPRLPGVKRLEAAGFRRGTPRRWPDDAMPRDASFVREWRRAWDAEPAFHVLPLLHPSAQNMSPFAGVLTQFHRRMVETRDALVAAVTATLGVQPPHPRPPVPVEGPGIYDLPEWRLRIGERHARFDELWRRAGV